ncbi:hypothetical protein RI048_03625 [Herbaspirillum huttiense SE1]|uniref:Uncharacterized protein n=1 Tax=Herbaspirillum huttiense subsp. lycopersici TaxID=3074428 RepID=A0ABU2EHN5_9BURK|nr:hypothetical protein [Herbaspirillum huttiense]MDR9847297.1 hypothetical protein [Herbaspirillum huttiense SE1]
MLIDSLEHANLRQKEYELRIKGLSDLDKGRILYNHIWHSSLSEEFIDEIYWARRYRKIIDHRNFNPRLISYITDAQRLSEISPANYWSYIERSLESPRHIWENPFNAQLDSTGRAIVLLVVFNGREISEYTLSSMYGRLSAGSDGQRWVGKMDFQASIKMLTGSFLNRTISEKKTTFDLFNPSIGDYVLERYASDVTSLSQLFEALHTE